MRYSKYIIASLILISLLLVVAGITYDQNNLKIIACDVGQGDAILIVQGSTEILIDGGPDNKVLDCMAKCVPFWDRTLELVVNTHPQKDHYMGILAVFERYQVQKFLVSGLDSSSPEFRVLQNLVGGGSTEVVYAPTTHAISSGLIHLDMLFPLESYVLSNSKPIKSEGKSIANYESDVDPNEFSVTFLLKYKKFTGIFTGDLSPRMSDLLAENPAVLSSNINYIKVPHHGSRNGMTEKLLEKIRPAVAVISVGRKNTYGHPHKEILEMLKRQNVKTFRTDIDGDIVVETNGEKLFY